LDQVFHDKYGSIKLRQMSGYFRLGDVKSG